MFPLYLKILCEYTTFLSVGQQFKVYAVYFDLNESIYCFRNSFYALRSHHTVEMNTLDIVCN